jgi:hypothetical protein
LQQKGSFAAESMDDEDWNDTRFWKVAEVRPIAINILMLISYKGV